MSNTSKTDPLIKIISTCSTTEQVQDAVNALDLEEKMRLVYEFSVAESFNESKQWSLRFLEYLDSSSINLDQQNSTGNQELLIGALLTASKLLVDQAEMQARLEMQHLTAKSKYGMQIADTISDYAISVLKSAEDLAQLISRYQAVLTGRKLGFRFTSEAEGTVM